MNWKPADGPATISSFEYSQMYPVVCCMLYVVVVSYPPNWLANKWPCMAGLRRLVGLSEQGPIDLMTAEPQAPNSPQRIPTAIAPANYTEFASRHYQRAKLCYIRRPIAAHTVSFCSSTSPAFASPTNFFCGSRSGKFLLAMASANAMKTKIPLPPHPFYPQEINLAGYLANDWDVPTLLAVFAGGWAVILGITLAVVKRYNPTLASSDKICILWFVLSRFTRSNVIVHLLIVLQPAPSTSFSRDISR